MKRSSELRRGKEDTPLHTVSVDASTRYDIHIGPGILNKLGPFLRQLKHVQKVCIVSDSNVALLYGAMVHNMLEHEDLVVTDFVFPSGEENKTTETYLALLTHLAQHQLTRTDLIIALGGGVTGDMAGFAAATYLRGIRYVQIPTTLLAAVDSSVGGKTAIDLPVGKNLVGAFHQPSFVLCDTDLLNTLSEDIFRDGCAEVVKYAILYDTALFDHLERSGLAFDKSSVIARCVHLKRDAVVTDEFDNGIRKKLNLGHTIGHAVEKASSFTISHGQAVSIGISIIARFAARTGLCPQSDCDRIISLLSMLGLPTHTSITSEELLQATLTDKKRHGDMIDLIIPRRIGDCTISSVSIEQIPEMIRTGM